MYEKDLALNNLQWLTYHQTKLNKVFDIYLYINHNVFDIYVFGSSEYIN